MDEKTRNAAKLDVEAVRATDSVQVTPTETYRSIPEYTPTAAAAKNSNMVRENNDHIEDGAADAMLAPSNEKEQLALNNEVKFISAEHKNGDAKIDIGISLEKAFTGMTKEELMRYANDPFWVRLRWIFFVLFWGLWIAMLVGAILIIVGAPKCAAPKALAWYKQGPLVRLPHGVDADALPTAAELLRLQSIGARGAIFTIPADDTYRIGSADDTAVDERIRRIVAGLQRHNIQPIADVTANFVHRNDALFRLATDSAAVGAADAQKAFVIVTHQADKPNNWLSKVNGSAWYQYEPKQFVLSQFGESRFDLQLNSTVAKDKLKAVLRQLAALGVRGVRLANAKHFIVSGDLRDEAPAAAPETVHTDYGYWQHTQTTYQPGLGDLLDELAATLKNATDGAGFLSLADNIGRPEAFRRSSDGQLAIELPIVGVLPRTLAQPGGPQTARQLSDELTRAVRTVGNASWVQWEYDAAELDKRAVGLSEYNAFVMLLPGVPVAGVEQFEVLDALAAPEAEVQVANATQQQQQTSLSFVDELEALRQTPSYMHGSFDVFTNANETVIAYTRIKSGNPGYFVAYNPTDTLVHANFTAVKNIPEQLTVHLYSSNYKVPNIVEKVKVSSNAIPVGAQSVLILTYVPKTAE